MDDKVYASPCPVCGNSRRHNQTCPIIREREAILRASFPAEASGELISELDWLRHAIGVNSGLGIDYARARNVLIDAIHALSRPAPSAEKALEPPTAEGYQALVDRHIAELRDFGKRREQALAHEAPKEAEHE